MNSALIFRLSAGYILRRVTLTSPLFGGDLIKGLVAGAISQANLGHLARDVEQTRRWGAPDSIAPLDLRRPISAYAVAAALGVPRETVRRKVKELTASGFLLELPAGFVVNAEHVSTPEVLATLAILTEATYQFCLDLVDAGHPGPVSAQPPVLHRAVMRMTTAYALRFFEELRIAADGDILGGVTFLALNAANVRHMDLKAALPDGVRFIPISDRRPATALSLAAELGQPRETVRRQLSKIVSMGYARRAAGGVLADPARLPTPIVDRVLSRNDANLRLLLTGLTGLGTR